MTQAEFYEAIRKARESYRDVMRKVNREISQLYIDAANEISDKIKTLTVKGKGDSLTAASMAKLESALRKTGARIAGSTEDIIVDSINKSITKTSGPHEEFLKDAIKQSDINKIKFDIIESMYSQLNEDLINLTYTRIWKDGYTFSDKIWGFPGELPGLSGYWQKTVKDIITSGFAQGRDILQIAKDLSVYAKKGKPGLMQRYGDLILGTKKFSDRIPKWIDWRAMRLARSELYISLQESAKLQGRMNPAVLAYIWNLTAGAQHDRCDCPDIAANSPYTENTLPGWQHANCLCYITYKIRGRDEFINDLIDWGNGMGVPYLDNWFQNVYLPAA